MSGSYLLDANALIALVVREHEHHDRVAAWSAGVDTMTLCPITEGALIRYLIRVGETSATASKVLAALSNSERVVFRADSLSFIDAALHYVTGHRQVTDAYLAALAVSLGLKLATLDQRLASVLPEAVELVP